MMDYRLALMVGIDIPIPELQLTLHIPTIKDIAYMGERNFFIALQYLCLDKEQVLQDENLLSSMTNFQVLMKVLNQSQDKEKKQAISTLLTILFPQYTNMITPRSIVLVIAGSKNPPIMIDDDSFELFKAVIKEVLCVNNLFQRDNVIYNPQSALAKKIAEKLMKGRQKIAQLKNGEGNNDSVLTRYISILTVAGITSLEACADYNLFQLFDLMERYTAKVEWDIDLKVRLAGGKPDKQVETWMRDLHSQASTAFTADSVPSGMKVY